MYKLNQFEEDLDVILGKIRVMLLEKNRAYGNSALDPVRVFSKADKREALKIRMDDKLSRIKTSDPSDSEDAYTDLLGYLILLKVGQLQEVREQSNYNPC